MKLNDDTSVSRSASWSVAVELNRRAKAQWQGFSVANATLSSSITTLSSPLSFIDKLKLNGDALASRTQRWVRRSLSWSVADEAQLADDVQFATLPMTLCLPPSRRTFTFHPVGDPSRSTQPATLRLPPSWRPFTSPKRVMGIFFFFPFELIFFVNFCLMILEHSFRKILDSYPSFLHLENVTGKIFSIEVKGRWEQILVVLPNPLQIYLLNIIVINAF